MALNAVESATQANADLASLSSYALSAIGIARTMGAQGRINTQEIQLAQNSLPNASDTVATVQQKLTNLNNILASGEKGIFGANTFTSYKPGTSTPLKDGITAAIKAGYSATSTVDYLKNDPTYGKEVTNALNQGISPQDIVNYLQTLNQ